MDMPVTFYIAVHPEWSIFRRLCNAYHPEISLKGINRSGTLSTRENVVYSLEAEGPVYFPYFCIAPEPAESRLLRRLEPYNAPNVPKHLSRFWLIHPHRKHPINNCGHTCNMVRDSATASYRVSSIESTGMTM